MSHKYVFKLDTSERHVREAIWEASEIFGPAVIGIDGIKALQEGISPISHTGDGSDIKVIDAEGREIPWNKVVKLPEEQMPELRKQAIDRFENCLEHIYSPSFWPE